MVVQRDSSVCLKASLIIYTILFWLSGFALIFLGFYVLFEPKRSYVLEFVNFSEDDPLLTFAAYTSIVAGIFTLFVGFIGFCGALQKVKCLLVGFMLSLIILFLADVAIGVLAVTYRAKIHSVRSPFLETLRNGIKFDYGVSMEIEKNRKFTAIIDKMQFYEECCGATTADDYLGSSWMAALASDPAYEEVDPPLVPESCCRQINGASALNPVARSLARCQQPAADKKWRHVSQQCCGGVGPKDYYNSFWYITNVERGTRSFVPRSCCKQSQSGRAWSVIPVDPMCTTYFYYSNAFNTSVNIDGCHEKMKKWFDEQTYIFAGVGFGFAALMMIGIIISLLLCNSITYYVHVDDQY